MTNALERFRDASGFGAESLVVLIALVATLIVTLWAAWSFIGQFQLWTGGSITVGQLLFGTFRVIGVMAAVGYVFSDFI